MANRGPHTSAERAVLAMLEEARESVDSMETMRKGLLKLSVNNRHEELREALSRSGKNRGMDRLLERFDREFLAMFPGFVDECEQTLGGAISSGRSTAVRERRAMPTELRMLALMRLGMLDVRSIAATLNVSVGTVYNHRSRLATALGPGVTLEAFVAKL